MQLSFSRFQSVSLISLILLVVWRVQKRVVATHCNTESYMEKTQTQTYSKSSTDVLCVVIACVWEGALEQTNMCNQPLGLCAHRTSLDRRDKYQRASLILLCMLFPCISERRCIFRFHQRFQEAAFRAYLESRPS